jgi:hypothetical protein
LGAIRDAYKYEVAAYRIPAFSVGKPMVVHIFMLEKNEITHMPPTWAVRDLSPLNTHKAVGQHSKGSGSMSIRGLWQMIIFLDGALTLAKGPNL